MGKDAKTGLIGEDIKIVKGKTAGQPVKWHPRHTHILLLTARGLEQREIATKLKIARQTVTRLAATEMFQAKLIALRAKMEQRAFEVATDQSGRKLIDKARERLVKASYRAAVTMTRLAAKGTPNDRIMLAAAQDILDRVGLKPKEVIETHERVIAPEDAEKTQRVLGEIEAHLQRLSNQGTPFLLKPPGPMSSSTDKGSAMPTPTPLVEIAPNPEPSTSEPISAS